MCSKYGVGRESSIWYEYMNNCEIWMGLIACIALVHAANKCIDKGKLCAISSLHALNSPKDSQPIDVHNATGYKLGRELPIPFYCKLLLKVV